MLEKIRKMDRNEALEMVLEQKDIDEKTKNLLQGILYKIEVSYSDYKKAKVINKTEKKYVDEIISNIKKRCNKIFTISFNEKISNSDISEELEKNKFYVDDKQIITYPIEEKLLYAIEKSINKKKIVNGKYGDFSKIISDFIITGKNIDRVEVLRDFNGWSWTTIKKEIENIPGIVNVIMSGDFEISSTSKFAEAGHNFYIQDGSTITLDGNVTMGSTVYIEGAVNVVAKGKTAEWSLCAGGNTIYAGGVLTTGKGVTLKGNSTGKLTIEVGGELKNAEAIDSSLTVVKK